MDITTLKYIMHCLKVEGPRDRNLPIRTVQAGKFRSGISGKSGQKFNEEEVIFRGIYSNISGTNVNFFLHLHG